MSNSGRSDGEHALSVRPTLSTLPLEIKARITELASLQDARFKERWIPGAPGEALVKALRNEWSGRSLVALAQTCRVFNELAAKHLFHTLHYTKFDSAYFSLRILPRHANHIRTVAFDRTEPSPSSIDTLRRLLGVLPSLPSLTKLRLDARVLRALIADPGSDSLEGVLEHSVDDYDAAACADVLRHALGRLESVELVGFPTADSMLPILELCPKIQSIGISDLDQATASVGSEALGRHLACLPALRSLSINARDLVLSEWVTQEWTCPIESLTLKGFRLELSHLAFIDHLAPTLHRLDLSFLEQNKLSIPPRPLLSQPLQSPHSLALRNCCRAQLEALTLPFTGTNPLNRLRRLDIDRVERHDYHHGLSIIINLIKTSPDLRHVRFFANDSPCYAFDSTLNGYEDSGIVFALDSRHDILVDPTLPPKPRMHMYTENIPLGESVAERQWAQRLGARHSALKRALEFGLRHIEHMLESRDDDAMEIALASLGPIWGMKLLEDD
ncbi:hypothetical protein RQP46_008090 [Phenoliferia psychrophenolica]